MLCNDILHVVCYLFDVDKYNAYTVNTGWRRRYVIWENLLYILSEYDARSPVYLGHNLHTHMPRGYMSGGAGYVISRPAVRKIVDEGVNFPSECPTDGAFEDVDVGRYLWGAEHGRSQAWAGGGALAHPWKM